MGSKSFSESQKGLIKNALVERLGMKPDETTEIVEAVADAFGGADEIYDGNLDPTIRSVFYTLESKRILTFRKEITTGVHGEELRTFFWRVRWDELSNGNAVSANPPLEADVYSRLPSTAWAHKA